MLDKNIKTAISHLQQNTNKFCVKSDLIEHLEKVCWLNIDTSTNLNIKRTLLSVYIERYPHVNFNKKTKQYIRYIESMYANWMLNKKEIYDSGNLQMKKEFDEWYEKTKQEVNDAELKELHNWIYNNNI